MNAERTVEILPCKLTPNELLLKGKELAETFKKVDSLEAEKKADASAFKDKIESYEAKGRELAREVSTGQEYRPIECFEEARYSTNMVDLVRSDSHEVVRSRPMDPSEKQPGLNFDRPDEPEEDRKGH